MSQPASNLNGTFHPVSAPDYLPLPQLRALQFQRLSTIIRRAYLQVGLFRQRMQDRGRPPRQPGQRDAAPGSRRPIVRRPISPRSPLEGRQLWRIGDWGGASEQIGRQWEIVGARCLQPLIGVERPGPDGQPLIAFGWYHSFIQFLFDHHAEGWFSQMIVFGELAVGVGLLLGALTGVAAAGGLLMSESYMLAGTAATSPVLTGRTLARRRAMAR